MTKHQTHRRHAIVAALIRKITLPLLTGAAALLITSGVEAQTTRGPQPSICNRACWVARNGTCGSTTSLNRAIIHHTAGGEYNTTGLSSSKSYVRGIQNMDMDVDGWCDIGYHFMVDKFGNIFECRKNSISGTPLGAHDSVNSGSFGFTFMGYFHSPNNNAPTTAMMNAMYDLIAWKMPTGWTPYGSGTYGGKTVGRIDGHRKVKSTACPGDKIHPVYITESYSGGTMRNSVAQRRGSTPPPPPAPKNTHAPRIKGDFNGDGKEDIVQAFDYGNGTTKLWVALSTGTGFGTASTWWTSTTFNSAQAQYLAGDFTGDGKADVAALYDYGNGTSKVFIMPSTGSAFGAAAIWWASAEGDWNADSSKMIGGDFNGDGITDLAMAYDYGNSWTKAWTWLSSGSGFTLAGVWWDSGEGNFNWDSAKFLSGDYDGDGKDDFMATYYYGNNTTKFWFSRSTGSAFTSIANWFTSTTWNDNQAKYVSGDLNADGKTDIVAAFDYGNSTMKFWTWLSAGTTFSPASVWMTSTTWNSAAAKYVAGDFTGDGKADVTALYDYGNSTSKFWTWPSSGTSFPSTSVWWTSTSWSWSGATPF